MEPVCSTQPLPLSIPGVQPLSIITAGNRVWYRVYSTPHVMGSQSSCGYVTLAEDRMALLVAMKKKSHRCWGYHPPLALVVSRQAGCMQSMGCMLLAHHPLLFVSNILGN